MILARGRGAIRVRASWVGSGFKPSSLLSNRAFHIPRYVDSSKAVIEKADVLRLQPVALSCVLNISACRLKMANWQGAVDSCLEVSWPEL